jgi:hypothetical protein
MSGLSSGLLGPHLALRSSALSMAFSSICLTLFVHTPNAPPTNIHTPVAQRKRQPPKKVLDVGSTPTGGTPALFIGCFRMWPAPAHSGAPPGCGQASRRQAAEYGTAEARSRDGQHRASPGSVRAMTAH